MIDSASGFDVQVIAGICLAAFRRDRIQKVVMNGNALPISHTPSHPMIWCNEGPLATFCNALLFLRPCLHCTRIQCFASAQFAHKATGKIKTHLKALRHTPELEPQSLRTLWILQRKTYCIVANTCEGFPDALQEFCCQFFFNVLGFPPCASVV